jgi:hypothetical protein
VITVADHHGGEALQDLKRIAVTDLTYPVLWLWQDEFLISSDSKLIPSALSRKPSRLVDRQGMAYRVVDIHSPWCPNGKLLRRAERRRLMERGVPPEEVVYSGEPVLLSVDQVREKIIWLVSARGHFEMPQGLPSSVSFAESVEDLLGVLLADGWRNSLCGLTKQPWWWP